LECDSDERTRALRPMSIGDNWASHQLKLEWLIVNATSIRRWQSFPDGTAFQRPVRECLDFV
jgi:hypothetical protein